MTARRVSVAIAAAMVGLTAACGVPSSEPQALPTELAELAQPPTEAETAAPSSVTVQVAWVKKNRLALVDRAVTADDRAARINAVLDAVVSGPDERDEAKGLSTLIAIDSRLSGKLDGRHVTIDLDLGTAPAAQKSQALAVGQIALSVLNVHGVRRVSFTKNGSSIEVPLPRGPRANAVVIADDYRDVTVNADR